jgi:hypothetical protein
MRYILCLSCLLISLAVSAQFSKASRYAELIGYNYNNGHFVELGVVRGYRCSYENTCEMVMQETLYSFAAVSTEFLISDELLVCPKVGYHVVLSFVHLGASIYDYTTLKENEFGFRPEAGLSFFGVAGIQYGYNLPIYSNANFITSNHNVSVKIILNSKLL